MKTRRVAVDAREPDAAAVAAAAAVLRAGGLVAFPTETVYGLGALFGDESAVRRIFAAKGRPEGKPLPLIAADEAMVAGVAAPPGLALALARAFFRDASFIILDEPTAALDARAEYELFENIRTLGAGRTVLLISHRFSSVRSADRIYVLDKGLIVESGSHDELMAKHGLYAELFTMQAAAYTD